MATIKGLEKLVVKLNNLSKVDLTKSLNRACIVVEDTAKENCPVDTGTLRRSITHEIEGDTGIIGTNIDYAPYIEFGTGVFATAGDGRKTSWRYKTADGKWHTTSGHEAKPFLQPALLMNEEKVKDILQNGLREEITKC